MLKLAAVLIAPFITLIIIITLITLTILLYNRFILKRHLPPLKSVKPPKKPSVFKRIFIQFPKQVVEDRLNAITDEFLEFGTHTFHGEQGAGKTIALVHMINEWKQQYPKMKVSTNFYYEGQDGEINHWQDIMTHNNGVYGQVIGLDEIQNWFSSLQSKDFPPDMMAEITQQRKQRMAICGTSQVFGRMAKPIREQCHYVYLPFTFKNCLTVVRKTKKEYYDDEKDRFKRFTGFYFFVHTPELRKQYDTYKKIQKLKQDGFHKNPWTDTADQTPKAVQLL